jgi:tetratricopeptide (TPR) repeat protein
MTEKKLILHPHFNQPHIKMAETTQDQDFIVTEAIGKTETFINQNKKSLGIIFGALILAVGGYLFYQKVYVANKEKEAQVALFYAEQWFNSDSLKLAVNGTTVHAGLEEIADRYSMSPSGNLAKYYLGMAYMRMNDFDKAIETLRGYDAKDEMTGAIVYGAIGDAYMEKKDIDEAINFYDKAASEKPNNFTTPIYLMKSGIAHEAKGDYSGAKTVYEKMKKDYASSTEAQGIDKYIARAEALMAK